MKNKKVENVVILDDIRSVLNVGAIFRTCDGAGIGKIYLCGYTPTPLDRFGRKRSDFHKSALGAEDFVMWEEKKDIVASVKKLKKDGYQIIVIEQDAKSINFKKIKLKEKNAFIFGNEVAGVSKKVLSIADAIGEIKMKGKKESLNVSVSVGVVLFNL